MKCCKLDVIQVDLYMKNLQWPLHIKDPSKVPEMVKRFPWIREDLELLVTWRRNRVSISLAISHQSIVRSGELEMHSVHVSGGLHPNDNHLGSLRTFVRQLGLGD